MQKQVRIGSNLFVFRVFCTAANHSKQNTTLVWSGLYRVSLLIIFGTNGHCCTNLHVVLYISTTVTAGKKVLSLFLSFLKVKFEFHKK